MKKYFIKTQFKLGDKVYPADGKDLLEDFYDGNDATEVKDWHGVITEVNINEDRNEATYEVSWVDADGDEIDTHLKSAWWDADELTTSREHWLENIIWAYEVASTDIDICDEEEDGEENDTDEVEED